MQNSKPISLFSISQFHLLLFLFSGKRTYFPLYSSILLLLNGFRITRCCRRDWALPVLWQVETVVRKKTIRFELVISFVRNLRYPEKWLGWKMKRSVKKWLTARPGKLEDFHPTLLASCPSFLKKRPRGILFWFITYLYIHVFFFISKKT